MNLQDRIEQAQTNLVALKDELVEATKLLEVSPEEDVLLTQVEELTVKVERQSQTTAALRKAEAALAQRAEKVESAAVVQSKHLGSVDGNGMMWKHATASFIAYAQRKSPEQVIAERYKDAVGVAETFDFVRKTAVNPAMTSVSGFAAELVQTDIRGFLDTLKTTSVGAALASRSQQLNFSGYNSITVPRRNPIGATPTEPAWTAEGAPIALTQFSFGSSTINRYKLACITQFTAEIAERSTPSIEGLLRSAMSEAYSTVLDQALLSAGAAIAGVRPAGLRNGLAGGATGAGDATGGQASLMIDIMALLAYLPANRTGSRPVLIMNNATRLSVSMLQSSLGEFLWRDEISAGRMLGMEVISSDNVPTGVVMVVDADALVTAFDVPVFDTSNVATLVEANADAVAPTMAGDAAQVLASGTPGQVQPGGGGISVGESSTPTANVGYTTRSLFQTNSIAIRMIAPTSWAMLRPNSVAQRTGVTW